MAEPRFDTDQIREEINGMADLAGEFLTGADSRRLRDTAFNPPKALRSGGVWQIPKDNPLETKESGREAGFLFGRMSFIWQVRSHNNAKQFNLENASTTIEIHSLNSTGAPISWNTDIGGAAHP